VSKIPKVNHAVLADYVLLNRLSIGEKVAINGGLVSVEIALHLAIKDKK